MHHNTRDNSAKYRYGDMIKFRNTALAIDETCGRILAGVYQFQ